MDDPWNTPTAVTVEVRVRLTAAGRFHCVNDLEAAILKAAQAGGCELYTQSFRRWQELWLEPRRDRYRAIRWRSVEQITPLGALRLPVRVVQDKQSGRHLMLSKLLWRGRAMRLLSPLLERRAVEEAVEQNYRPAARSLVRWAGAGIETRLAAN